MICFIHRKRQKGLEHLEKFGCKVTLNHLAAHSLITRAYTFSAMKQIPLQVGMGDYYLDFSPTSYDLKIDPINIGAFYLAYIYLSAFSGLTLSHPQINGILHGTIPEVVVDERAIFTYALPRSIEFTGFRFTDFRDTAIGDRYLESIAVRGLG